MESEMPGLTIGHRRVYRELSTTRDGFLWVIVVAEPGTGPRRGAKLCVFRPRKCADRVRMAGDLQVLRVKAKTLLDEFQAARDK